MRKKSNHTHSVSGITLIELMVALFIASILLLGVASIYVSSKRGYLVQDSLSRQQENSRFSLELLMHDLRMAGYPKTFVLEPIVAATTSDGGGSANDAITVQYESNTDCLGQPTPACADNASFNCAVNRYFIANDPATNENALFCQGNGAGGAVSDVIADHVTNLQILYGLDTDTAPDGIANKYVTWNNVAAANRSKIVSVRFALLSETPKDVKKKVAPNPINFPLLDQVIAVNDKRIHRVYSSTVVLRNREQ